MFDQIEQSMPNLLTEAFDEQACSDPIGCETMVGIRLNRTLGQQVETHQINYNFPQSYNQDIEEAGYEHDVMHVLLDVAFKKMGYSIIPLPYAHNGNVYSEALTSSLQLRLTQFIDRQAIFSDEDSRSHYNNIIHDAYRWTVQHNDVMKAAWALANLEEVTTTMFDVRHRLQFRDNLIRQYASRLEKPWHGDANRHGEVYEDFRMFTQDKLDEVFETVTPALNLIIDRLREEPVPMWWDAKDKRIAYTEALRKISMQDIWAAMPDGDEPSFRYPETRPVIAESTLA